MIVACCKLIGKGDFFTCCWCRQPRPIERVNIACPCGHLTADRDGPDPVRSAKPPPAYPDLPDPNAAMFEAIGKFLPVISALLEEGRKRDAEQARLHYWRTCVMVFLVAGKSWEEAQHLAFAILSAEDSAASAVVVVGLKDLATASASPPPPSPEPPGPIGSAH